jgi:PTS system mannose-specific IIA component
MLRVLLVTHGALGEALLETAAEIIGPREGVEALSNRGLDRAGLVARLRDHLLAVPAEEGLLLLTDMPGGSTHLAARLALRELAEPLAARVHGPLTGVNLPLLLTVLNRRESTPPAELLEILVDRGRAGITL